jgi:phosphopantothenoylcysteine decarboxylase/phosphopantothenate--cysteine ligase
MWDHPATRENVARVRARGVTVLEPEVGALGSIGEHGAGRLPEPAQLLAAVEATSRARDLEGVRVLVTAGGTREPIDAVRFVGNRSSGRMGYAVAAEAARRGAAVTVVAANVALPDPPGVTVVPVETAAQLHATCIDAFDAGCDVLLMAAAVADYRPAEVFTGKVKKDQQGDALRLRLERTEDVLAALADRRRPGQVLVGFAAEAGEGAVAYGRGKLERKRLDAVVVNDVAQPGIGFDAADNEVTIVTATGDVPVPRAAKDAVARVILDTVLSLRSSTPQRVQR